MPNSTFLSASASLFGGLFGYFATAFLHPALILSVMLALAGIFLVVDLRAHPAAIVVAVLLIALGVALAFVPQGAVWSLAIAP